MSRCIKTGAILDLPKDDQIELQCLQWYGDIHLVGTALVGWYPRQTKPNPRSSKPHGALQLPSSGAAYFQRNAEPYCILVIPAHCVQWYDGALHEYDQLLYDIAQHKSLQLVGS